MTGIVALARIAAMWLAWPAPPARLTRRLTSRRRVRITRGADLGHIGIVVASEPGRALVSLPDGRWWYRADDTEEA